MLLLLLLVLVRRRRRREARAGWELPTTIGALQRRRRHAVGGHSRRARHPGVAERPEAVRRLQPGGLDRWGGEVWCAGHGVELGRRNPRAQWAHARRQAGHEPWREGSARVLREARVEGVEVAILGRRRLLAVADLFWGGRGGGVVGHGGEAGRGGGRVGVLVISGGDGRDWWGSKGWDVAVAAIRLWWRWWYRRLGQCDVLQPLH